MPRTMKLQPTGRSKAWTPLLISRRLRHHFRKRYLKMFWSLHARRQPFTKHQTQWPTPWEYKQVKMACEPYTREMDRLTRQWIKINRYLRDLEGKAIRRAIHLRKTGRI